MRRKRKTTVRRHPRRKSNGSYTEVKRHPRNLPDKGSNKKKSRPIPPSRRVIQPTLTEKDILNSLRKIASELSKFKDEYRNLSHDNFWKILLRSSSSNITDHNLPKNLKYTKEVIYILNNYRNEKISEEEMYNEFKSLGKSLVVENIKITTAYAISTNTGIPYRLIRPCSDIFIDYGVDGLELIFSEKT